MNTNLIIRDMPEKDLKNHLVDWLVESFELIGSKVDNERILLLVKNTYEILMKRYQGFTFEDVKSAIDLGRSGEFGENYGINPDTIGKWFRGYNEKIRQPRNKAFLASSEGSVVPEKKPEDVYFEVLKDFEEKFNLYKKGQYKFENIFLNVSFYNTLDFYNYLNFSSERKKVVFEEMSNKVISREKEQNNRQEIFKAFILGAKKGNSFFEEVVLMCKDFLLKEFVKNGGIKT